mmetsp:Transcript_20916/g.33535  ORF Transcript_20916/g.33535 Transcript_20916/m.33535 type:complete len:120 (-) Transcript_20916:12-371(-)
MAQKILTLWAVPRSTSTAFEWMMRQRGDLHCLHEPFCEAWYQGEAPLWPRATADSLRTPGLTYDTVIQKLEGLRQRHHVFIKDFAHCVADNWTPGLEAIFEHSFLIRSPDQTLTSMFAL